VTDAPSPVPPPIPCPFVYADGRCCTGHIVRIETYKADLAWERDDGGTWHFDLRTRTHLHLFCSEKGNHAGFKRQDPRAMKYWFDQLPAEVQDLLLGLPTPKD
jgi:hypothetical protein